MNPVTEEENALTAGEILSWSNKPVKTAVLCQQKNKKGFSSPAVNGAYLVTAAPEISRYPQPIHKVIEQAAGSPLARWLIEAVARRIELRH